MPDLTAMCKQVTEKVKKLFSGAQTFISTIQTSAESNTSKANEVVMGLNNTLQNEKEALVQFHTGLQTDNTDFQTSISTKIVKLQEDLAVESNIMDELAAITMKVKVQATKIAQANKDIDELKNLAEKYPHALAMLNQIEGVSEFPILPKQGEESFKEQPPKATTDAFVHGEQKSNVFNEPMVNVASGSKGKEKLVESEDEEETKADKLKSKAHDQILDENAHIVREAEEKE
ncbi:unnamed protein product [Lactuca saligna]|uniref:Uncharacterized protein n=1 Tax=Lactuca saligna TaxID=75948 RepID=A0AA35ZT55_LACSI|nr:unnamed protein product [Lactuca saligna]